jgi:hypothetical protein
MFWIPYVYIIYCMYVYICVCVCVCARVRVRVGATSPACYPMSTGALSPGVERPESETDRSLPTGAVVKEMWIYTSTPAYVFTA